MSYIDFCHHFNLEIPLIQAPMAGVSTPELAAEICNNGAIGSLGLGASSPDAASRAIETLKKVTRRPFNINFFCHKPVKPDEQIDDAWLQKLSPLFHKFNAEPPRTLREIYSSFYMNDELFELVMKEKPAIVSFHFGLPETEKILAMKQAGIYLIATATNLDEAWAIEKAGLDAIIAQGYEAGGHRGTFDENLADSCLSLKQLLKIILKNLSIPVIAAGGLMDGQDIAECIKAGASAVQLGTAFIACPQSQADSGYKQTLASQSAYHTVMTRAFSGRPARALYNSFVDFTWHQPDKDVPSYPYAYDAAKQIASLAKEKQDFGFGAYWAGQGAPFSRPMDAKKLLACLKKEFLAAMQSS